MRKKLRNDLVLSIERVWRAKGLFDDENEHYVIKIDKNLSLFSKISVLTHEIIHYLSEKNYLNQKIDDEKIAYLVEKLTKKGIDVIVDYEKKRI